MVPSDRFDGFPHGLRLTPVPDPLLGSLLERIDDLAELKVTLRAIWLASQRRVALPMVPVEEFLNDKVLVEGLRMASGSPREAILRGLELAVRRRTLLRLPDNGHGICYTVNTEANRRAITRRTRGEDPPSIPTPPAIDDDPRYELAARSRPNIYALYENNIGTMTSTVAEQLKDAEGQYPEAWLREAFRLAVSRNVRSWAYVEAILRRWTDEGRDNGKSRRNSPADNRAKYIDPVRRRGGDLPGGPGRG